MVNMGEIRLRQPIPQGSTQQIGPFLLLHHAGPYKIEPGQNPMDIGPHPHRGFDPVTFVFQGAVHHRDSLGNDQTVRTGGVQWIRAGSGIIHAEGPDADFIANGGVLEIIQLWINAPAVRKMDPAAYYPVAQNEMPKHDVIGNEIYLVSGKWNEVQGPVPTPENILSAMAYFKKGRNWEWEYEDSQERVIYLLDGEVSVEGKTYAGPALLHLNKGKFEMEINEDAKALVLSGQELKEPVATYGPFVMNSQREIMDALKDYQAGKMGVLEP